MGATKLLLPICVVAALCACTTKAKKQEQQVRRLNKATATKLQEVAENYNKSVQRAGRRILSQDPELAYKRRAVEWKMATHTACRRAQLVDNRIIGFLDLWTMAKQREEFMRRSGEAYLGEYAAIGIETEKAIDDYIDRTCKDLFPPDVYDVAKQNVEEFAAANPIGKNIRIWNSGEHPPSGSSVWGKMTKAIPSLGLKKTAGSIAEVAQSVDGIGQVVEDLPLMARWNTQLMMYDMNENQSVVALRAGLKNATDGVAEIARAADELPEDVKEIITHTFGEIEKQQPALRQTIGDVKGTITETKETLLVAQATVKAVNETTLKEVGTMVDQIDGITSSFARAGRDWEPTMKELHAFINVVVPPRDPSEPRPPSTPGPDEDLVVIQQTVDGLSATAVELHATITEVRGILEGDAPEKLTSDAEEAIKHTAERLSDIVDRALIGLFLLSVGIAAVMLGYRFLARRIPKD